MKPFDPFYGHYLVYAPGFDRVLYVDHGDPFTVMETAQILSSKVPLVVGSVKTLPTFNDQNCLEYTIKDKNIMFASSSIFYSRQWPSFRRLNTSVEHKGWPDDYVEDIASVALKELQEYALFVAKCVKAIRITNLIFNTLPINQLALLHGPNTIPDNLSAPVDQSDVELGISVTLLSILYNGLNKESTLDDIDKFWGGLSDVVLYRNQFYQLIDQEQSDELKENKFSGKVTGFAV
jgi:hypothetical protein